MYDRSIVEEDRAVRRAPWSPAQFIALAIALFYIVLGGVAIARAGLDLNSIVDSHKQVAGLHHSLLLGILELVFGLFLLGAGALPGADRYGMITLGVIGVGLGLVVAIEPTAFHSWLGVHAGNGWLYALTGVVLLATAMLAPVIWSGRRDTVGAETHERVTIDR